MAASGSPTIVQHKCQRECLLFDFAPLRAFDFDQKLTQNVPQIVLYYHVTKQFLPCLNWLITCFRFQYHVSKDFLRLHFAVDQVFSISGCGLENGRMPC